MNKKPLLPITEEDPSTWETIADVLNDSGKENVKLGDVLSFKQADGSDHHYKLMQVDKDKDIFMVKQVEMFDPEDVGVEE